ncbi:hypothetical protein KI387_023824, partial [Taxus chinensis]
YELPFVYPGQIYGGHVTSVHLYQGAFVFIGCVHDGWVPIKGNDWYWVRHHIKVGMHVQVEVVAKRNPFRFRFPIELRFVNPNIDHLIFNRFEFPPIIGRNDTNPEELCRETGRPYIPRRRPAIKPEDQPLSGIHPYSKKIGQIHVSEQVILDEEENDHDENGEEDDDVDELDTDNKSNDSENDGNWIQDQCEDKDENVDEPDMDNKLYESDNDGYRILGQNEDCQLPKIGQMHISEQAVLDEGEKDANEKGDEDEYVDQLDTDNKVYDSNNDGYWIQGQYGDLQLPKRILTTDEKDLDLDAARAERKIISQLKEESKAQGKSFVRPKLHREKQMDEFDAMHKHRLIEEREALIRDISCRRELGLPLEEPGRYADDDLWSNIYTTWNHKYRSDYWGDPNNIEKDSPKVQKTSVESVSVGSTPINAGDNSTTSTSTDVDNVGDYSASKTIGMPMEEYTRNDKTVNFSKGKTMTNPRNSPLVKGTESFSKDDVRGIFNDQ